MMKSILVINDHSTAANYAAQFALSVAQKVHANLILLNAAIPVNILPDIEYEFVTANKEANYIELPEVPLAEQLKVQNQAAQKFRPMITGIDPAYFSAGELMQFVQQQDVWMVVKGIPGEEAFPRHSAAGIQAILNKAKCPMLLVPERPEMKDFKHIVHTVDLRYCKLSILNFLVELAMPYRASLLLAHIPMSGLPSIEKKEALDIFREISSHTRYTKLFFDQIKEKNLEKVYDVLAHGMNTDLLAVVNHQFHFEKIVSQYKCYRLPTHITVPLLVFPY
jgi:nucleotide-binding universal stress UspA family protein